MKFTSIAEWAASLGSSAKTRAWQRKAILAHIAIISPLPAMGPEDITRRSSFWVYTSRANYLQMRRRERQERFAATHPLTLSSPPPATIADVYGHRRMVTGPTLDDIHIDIPTPITSLEPGRDSYSIVGDWVIRAVEIADWKNDRYSKTWHRQHGGVREVYDRIVMIRRVRPDGTLEKRDIHLAAWRGNWALNALVAAGVVEEHSGNMQVRLHTAFEIHHVFDEIAGRRELARRRGEDLIREGYQVRARRGGSFRVFSPDKHGVDGGYVVTEIAAGQWVCSCPAYAKSGNTCSCKHVEGLSHLLIAEANRATDFADKLRDIAAGMILA